MEFTPGIMKPLNHCAKKHITFVGQQLVERPRVVSRPKNRKIKTKHALISKFRRKLNLRNELYMWQNFGSIKELDYEKYLILILRYVKKLNYKYPLL